MMKRILPMKDNNFLKKLLFNWPEKILCFVVAVLIYFLFQGHTLDKKNISVPLEVVDNGQVTLGKELPRFVRISLRGKATDLATINENDITALIDISSYTETGVYEVPINLSFTSKVIAINPLEIKVDPDYLRLNMETKSVGYLTPVITYDGQIPDGYKIDTVEFSPDKIKIIGPTSIVNKIKNINTTPVDVTDVTNNISEIISLEKVNKLISFPDGDKVQVKISVAPVIMEKDFSEYEISCRNLFGGYVSKTDKVLIEAKISGPELKVNAYNRLRDFAYVDCALIDDVGEYELELKFDLPSDVVLKSYSPEKIIVTVNDFSTLYSEVTSDDTSSEVNETEIKESENKETQASESAENIKEIKKSEEPLLEETEKTTEVQEVLSEEKENNVEDASGNEVKQSEIQEDASEKPESDETVVEGLL